MAGQLLGLQQHHPPGTPFFSWAPHLRWAGCRGAEGAAGAGLGGDGDAWQGWMLMGEPKGGQ